MLKPSPQQAGRLSSGVSPLLIAMAVLLAAAILPACSSAPKGTKKPTFIEDPALRDKKIKEDVAALRVDVETYFNRYGELPTRLPDLRETPDGDAMLDEIPRDPWSVPYLLRKLGDDVLIYSTGEDLLIGTDDDQGIRLSFAGVTPDPDADPNTGSPGATETPLREKGAEPQEEPTQESPADDAATDEAPQS